MPCTVVDNLENISEQKKIPDFMKLEQCGRVDFDRLKIHVSSLSKQMKIHQHKPSIQASWGFHN